jgi:hypothetical protein
MGAVRLGALGHARDSKLHSLTAVPFLAAVPVLAFAFATALCSRGLSTRSATAVAVPVAAALGVVPALAFSIGNGGEAGPDVSQVLVLYGPGWHGPVLDDNGRPYRLMGTEGELAVSPALVGRPRARLRFEVWSYGAERQLTVRLRDRFLMSTTVGPVRSRVSFIVPAGRGAGVLTLSVDPPAEPVALRGLDSVYAVGLAVADETLGAQVLGPRP